MAALLLPAAGHAQIAPTFSGSSTSQAITGEAFLEDLSRVGKCLAETKRSKSEAFIAATLGTPEEAAAYKQLIGKNTTCLADLSRMSVSRPLFRGAIAEGLYRAQFAAGAPTPPGPAAAGGIPRTVMGQFADCYARAHPREVHALVTGTKIASKEERAAFFRMASGFGACLPAGTRVALQPSEVRLSLAEALYRSALGSQPAG